MNHMSVFLLTSNNSRGKTLSGTVPGRHSHIRGQQARDLTAEVWGATDWHLAVRAQLVNLVSCGKNWRHPGHCSRGIITREGDVHRRTGHWRRKQSNRPSKKIFYTSRVILKCCIFFAREGLFLYQFIPIIYYTLSLVSWLDNYWYGIIIQKSICLRLFRCI